LNAFEMVKTNRIKETADKFGSVRNLRFLTFLR